MAAINWKTYDTGEIVTEIRQNRRYKLASPSTVTGTPSLAMQSATQFAIVYIYVDDVKLSTPLTISGNTKTPIAINGQTPSKEDLLTLSIEIGGIGNGEVILTTDEPNGSPSAPFTTVDERTAWATANLASLLSGRTTVWGPGNVEYVWNGPLATDWQGIRGPYLGTPSNPFPDAAALLVAYPSGGRYVGERIAMANPAIVPRGWSWLEWSGLIWFVPVGEPIAQQWGMDNAYLADQTPGALVLTKIFQSPIIPDAFLPIKQKYELVIFATVINSSGVAGCRMGACISGGTPSSSLVTLDYNYIAATSLTPTSNGVGFTEQNVRYPGGRSSDGLLLHSRGGTGKILRNGATPNFISGNNRFYLMGQPSHAADRFVFEGGYSITSLGVAA